MIPGLLIVHLPIIGIFPGLLLTGFLMRRGPSSTRGSTRGGRRGGHKDRQRGGSQGSGALRCALGAGVRRGNPWGLAAHAGACVP